MDIVNIINNFDQNILMENILIINQIKLLNLVIELLEIESKNEELTYEYISKSLNEKKFLNWDLFIRLINLNSTFLYHNKLYTSLFYFVEKKCIKILSFLLDLDENVINWENTNAFDNQNIFHQIFKKLYKHDNLILKIIHNNNKFNYLLNKMDIINKTPIDYLISNCSEDLILESLDNMIIGLDYIDLFNNTLVHLAVKRKFIKLIEFLIEKKVNLNILNLGGRSPIHLSCIKNNIEITKLLVENKVDLEVIDKNFLKPINYAITNGKIDLIKYLIENNVELDDQIINQIIKNQDKNTIEYIFNNKSICLSNTEYLTNIFNLLFKGCFYQMYELSVYKLTNSIINFINQPQDYYDGKYIGNVFENKND